MIKNQSGCFSGTLCISCHVEETNQAQDESKLKLICHWRYESNSNLSASSRISTSTLLRWNEGALCRWSISRPGVAITMSGNWRSAASCDFISSPPTAQETFHLCHSLTWTNIPLIHYSIHSLIRVLPKHLGTEKKLLRFPET